MHPILFHIGPLTVYSYGVLVATGVLLGLWYARRQAPRAGLDPEKVWNLGIYVVLAALIIAKIWLVLSAWDYYLANPRKIFSIETFQSGGTFYGGMVGAVLTVVLYTYFQKMPLLPVMDTIGAAVPLGHVIGRLGCFAAGCCFGKPTTHFWGVTFTNPLAAQYVGTPLGQALEPTQLFESAAELIIFATLTWMLSRKKFDGQIFGAYLFLYGIARFLLEFLRGDPGRGGPYFGGLLTGTQLIAIGLVLTGGIIWYLRPTPRVQIASAHAR